MLAYHAWSRAKYLDLFERLPWRVLVRHRGATFESIRNVHVHVLQVYAWWLVHFFHRREVGPLLATTTYPRSVRELRRMDRTVDAAVRRVARTLRPNALDRKTVPPVLPGHEAEARRWRITPREVLWHLVEEDFLHHGEILCMLWQDDIEPPYTGVWWFEYDRDPVRHRDLWYADPETPRPSAGGYVSSDGRRGRAKA